MVFKVVRVKEGEEERKEEEEDVFKAKTNQN